jgi:hypothetical protein
MHARRAWTADEESYLLANARSSTYRDIGAHLDRSERSVYHRAQKLGVRLRELRRWTAEEDDALRGYIALGLDEAARRLSRISSEVSQRAGKLGVPFRQRTVRRRRKDRYVVIGAWADGKRQRHLEHRLIAAEALGRPLVVSERVHHINFDKSDNRPDNLYVCRDRGHHQRVHRSVDSLVPALLERGLVRFDRATGRYELCATDK